MSRHSLRIVIVWGLILLFSAKSSAADSLHEVRYLNFFAGPSFRSFGSEDPRSTLGFNLQWERPEPRLKLWRTPGQIVYESYINHSFSNGVENESAITTVALGGLVSMRYNLGGRSQTVRPFVELGVGLQYADKRTHDLPSKLNSTPSLGVGIHYRVLNQPWTASVRWFHISNAGTLGKAKHLNRGQNQLLFSFGTEF
jgi:Lipid A 3-O-deacylase (PagL)